MTINIFSLRCPHGPIALRRLKSKMLIVKTRPHCLSPATLPTGVTFYRGSALEAKHDQATETRFLSTAAGHLQGTEWSGLLDRATKDSTKR